MGSLSEPNPITVTSGAVTAVGVGTAVGAAVGAGATSVATSAPSLVQARRATADTKDVSISADRNLCLANIGIPVSR